MQLIQLASESTDALPASREGRAVVAYDVVDTLEGFCALVKRSATLDGSVPQRAARACQPLLEGNAWGHQVSLRQRIELRRRLGRWQVTRFDEGADATALHNATRPVLAAGGALTQAPRELVDARGKFIALYTGLFVRPRAGVRMRLSSTANRRSLDYTVEESFIEGEALAPLVLRIVPRAGADRIVLHGELATLAALPAQTRVARRTLLEAPEVARAHLAFYDAQYFATKNGGAAARKYRDAIVPSASRTSELGGALADADIELVEAGPSCVSVESDRLVFGNAVPFTAAFDGMHVTIEHDAGALAAYASTVRATWEAWFAVHGAPAHPGALLYLTKYFTPHPPGEPHFFVKPAALVRTAPGVSTVIDGVPRATSHACDVLRGVVHTHAFHAAPAVFQLREPGTRVRVEAGEPLASFFPCSRELLQATFALHRGGLHAAFARGSLS